MVEITHRQWRHAFCACWPPSQSVGEDNAATGPRACSRSGVAGKGNQVFTASMLTVDCTSAYSLTVVLADSLARATGLDASIYIWSNTHALMSFPDINHVKKRQEFAIEIWTTFNVSLCSKAPIDYENKKKVYLSNRLYTNKSYNQKQNDQSSGKRTFPRQTFPPPG